VIVNAVYYHYTIIHSVFFDLFDWLQNDGWEIVWFLWVFATKMVCSSSFTSTGTMSDQNCAMLNEMLDLTISSKLDTKKVSKECLFV